MRIRAMRVALFAATAMIAMIAVSAPADADVLVLRSEGTLDTAGRAKLDAAILKLAKSTGAPTSAGDITFSDAAAAVGCQGEDAACKDEILGMLAVDEVVTVDATRKPGGIEIHVRRIARGGVTRTATTVVPADQPDQIAAIGPLFGAVTPAQPAPPPVTPAVTTTPPAAPLAEPTPAPPPPAQVTEPAPSIVATPRESAPPDDRPHPNRRLQTIGMIGGGALLVVGLVYWGSAAGVAGDIDAAPNRTRAELLHLQDLEQQGDDYAAAGNFLVLTGAILGGISTYYFVKGRRAQRAATARLTPTLIGDGAGLALTFGGSP